MGKSNQVWEVNQNVKVEVKYKGNSQRPTEFSVQYNINGEQVLKNIINK